MIMATNHMDQRILGLAMQDIKREFLLSDTQLGLLTGIAFGLLPVRHALGKVWRALDSTELAPTLSTPRAQIRAKALVTRRLRPLQIDGRTLHQVGMPWHWGYEGVVTGDVVLAVGSALAVLIASAVFRKPSTRHRINATTEKKTNDPPDFTGWFGFANSSMPPPNTTTTSPKSRRLR